MHIPTVNAIADRLDAEAVERGLAARRQQALQEVCGAYMSEPYMCGGEPCVSLGNHYQEMGHDVDQTVTYTLSDLRHIVARLEVFEEEQAIKACEKLEELTASARLALNTPRVMSSEIRKLAEEVLKGQEGESVETWTEDMVESVRQSARALGEKIKPGRQESGE